MSHFPGAIFHMLFYGGAVVLFFAVLWHWRRWYVAATDDALARRSVWGITGVSLVFLALWLTCGKTAFGVTVLKWAISPLAFAGFGCLLQSMRTRR